jgi:hypothetical protein
MEQDIIARVRARASRPTRVHDMARGMSPTPRIHPACSQEQIAAAEVALGFALPVLYKRILLEIGNGGFGPGYGLIGATGGYSDFGDGNLPEIYARSHSPIEAERGNFPLLPERVVPVCNWGCAIYSCLDCREEAAPVYFFNPDLHVLDDPTLDAILTNTRGNAVWTYQLEKAGAEERATQLAQTRLFLHKKSFEEWISAWANGVKLWDEMEELLASL